MATDDLPFEESARPSLNPSRDAYLDVKKKLPKLQKKVFEAIKARGQYGATDEEIQSITEMEGNTVRPRRLELVVKGLIREAPFQRKTKRGKWSLVWIVTRGEADEPDRKTDGEN